jgi:oligoribonuclease
VRSIIKFGKILAIVNNTGIFMTRDKNLIWIDLEMTGLNVDKDVILEIACVITDSQLNILDNGLGFVIHQSEESLESMCKEVKEMHQKSGLIERVRESKTGLGQAETQLLQLFKKYCDPKTGLLSGNSVWQDKNFMRKYTPSLADYCNYRILDVSTIKEVVARWYPDSPNKKFEKAEKHRAMQDILGSIEELKHFRKYFFQTTLVASKF